MIRNAKICTAGECGGECWRCSATQAAKERDEWRELARKMFDVGVCSGVYGPWHDSWTERDREMLWTEDSLMEDA